MYYGFMIIIMIIIIIIIILKALTYVPKIKKTVGRLAEIS